MRKAHSTLGRLIKVGSSGRKPRCCSKAVRCNESYTRILGLAKAPDFNTRYPWPLRPAEGRSVPRPQAAGPKSRRAFTFAEGCPPQSTSLDHQHIQLRKALKLSSAFVLNSLRYTYGTQFGKAQRGEFAKLCWMGHPDLVVSRTYGRHTAKKRRRYSL